MCNSVCSGKKLGEEENANYKKKVQIDALEKELNDLKKLHADQCDMVSNWG